MAYNQYNVTKSAHSISMTASKIYAPLLVGMGVDCNDPLDPVPALIHPFYQKAPIRVNGPQIGTRVQVGEVRQATVSFVETTNARTLADALQANMRGSYGFATSGSVSAEAAYNTAHEIIEKGKAIVALISSVATGESLDEDKIEWAARELELLNTVEAIADERAGQRQFIEQFGSHFVFSVQNGFRLAVLGTIESKDDTETQSFSASFKAAFATASIDAAIAQQHRQTLSSGKVTIKSELVCARLVPDLPLITESYDSVIDLLTKIGDGTVKIERGPVFALARSYRPTLFNNHPNTAAILSPDEPTTLEAPYGVPAGTVIAWYPPNDAIYQDDAGNRQIKVPRGWKVADGQPPHDLNLIDRFVRGGSTPADYGRVLGSESHNHTGSTDDVPRGAWRGAGGGDQQFAPVDYHHTFTTQLTSNIPPHVTLMYLVKL
jgi:hypothetical protein